MYICMWIFLSFQMILNMFCTFFLLYTVVTFFFSYLAIVVVQNATVLDLKKAIRRFMELKQQREGGVKHVSW